MLPVEEVQDSHGGDSKKDAHHAEGPAAYDDAHQDPQAGHAQGVSEELGLEDVAVDGLQNRREDQEREGVPGVHHQQHEAADEGAEHGAEGGEQVEHGHHEGYEAHVGHAHDGHEEGVGPAHDQAVQEVEDDVPVQDGVAPPQDLRQLLVLGSPQGGGQQPLAPVLQPGLVAQQVDGQQEAHQELDRPLAHAGGGGQYLAQVLLHEVGDGLDEGLGGIDELVQPQSRGGHAQGIQHGVEGGHVPVQVPGEGGHALDELRDEH